MTDKSDEMLLMLANGIYQTLILPSAAADSPAAAVNVDQPPGASCTQAPVANGVRRLRHTRLAALNQNLSEQTKPSLQLLL